MESTAYNQWTKSLANCNIPCVKKSTILKIAKELKRENKKLFLNSESNPLNNPPEIGDIVYHVVVYIDGTCSYQHLRYKDVRYLRMSFKRGFVKRTEKEAKRLVRDIKNLAKYI